MKNTPIRSSLYAPYFDMVFDSYCLIVNINLICVCFWNDLIKRTLSLHKRKMKNETFSKPEFRKIDTRNKKQ